MENQGVDDILGKLPKKTPLWAVGLVTVVVSVTAALIAVYTVSRPEIQQYLAGVQTSKVAQDTFATSTLTSLLTLVHDNSVQITQLSGVIIKSQQDATEVSNRVNVLEKEVSATKLSLEECQSSLKKYKR